MSGALPHLYAVEDVGEASIVAALLERGVRHRDVRSAIEALRHHGAWPLSEAELGTSDGAPRAQVVLYEDGDALVLGERGWQQSVFRPDSRPVRLRLRRRGRRGT